MKLKIISILLLILVLLVNVRANIDSLIVITKNGTDIEKRDAFLELSNTYMRTDLSQLQASLDSAEIYLKLTKENHQKLGLYHFNYALVYYYDGEINEALNQYHEAKKHYKLIKNNKKLALTLNNIGVVNNDLGQYDKSINYYKEALYIYEILDNKSRIALVSNNIGIVYMSWGYYKKSLEFYSQARKNYSLENDSNGIAVVEINIANVYSELNYTDKAEEKYLSAISIFKKLKIQKGTASCYNNIGELYSGQNNNLAIDYFLKAAEIFKKENYLKGITISFINVANEYRLKKNYSKADEYLKKSSDLIAETNDLEEQANLLFNKALLLNDRNKKAEAEDLFLQALDIALENNYKRLVIKIYEDLFKFYKENNNYKAALLFTNKYYTLKDSLNSIEIHQQVAELQNSVIRVENENKIKQQTLILENSKLILRQRTIVMYSFAAGSFLLLFLLGFLYRANKKKKKINEILREQNEVIVDQKEELEIKFEQSESSKFHLNQAAIAANETDSGILILNTDLRIIWKNYGFDKIIRHSIDNYDNISLEDIFPNNNNIKDKIKRCLETLKPERFAVEYTTSKNTVIWLQIILNPVLDDNTDSYKLILLASDITTYKVLNDSLKEESAAAIEIHHPKIDKTEPETVYKKIEGLNLSDGVNQQIIDLLKKDNYKTRILVSKGPAIVPIKVNSISYFYTENKVVWAMLDSKERYATSYTLEEIQNILNPLKFFRVNRQFIISVNSISKIITFSKNKLELEITPPVKEKIFISRAKISEFKDWLIETV